MKRSDMVKLIKKSNDDWITNVWLNRNLEREDMIPLGEYILDDIEKAGMLPPCINLSTGGDFTKEDCQQMADDYEGHFLWHEESYGEDE